MVSDFERFLGELTATMGIPGASPLPSPARQPAPMPQVSPAVSPYANATPQQQQAIQQASAGLPPELVAQIAQIAASPIAQQMPRESSYPRPASDRKIASTGMVGAPMQSQPREAPTRAQQQDDPYSAKEGEGYILVQYDTQTEQGVVIVAVPERYKDKLAPTATLYGDGQVIPAQAKDNIARNNQLLEQQPDSVKYGIIQEEKPQRTRVITQAVSEPTVEGSKTLEQQRDLVSQNQVRVSPDGDPMDVQEPLHVYTLDQVRQVDPALADQLEASGLKEYRSDMVYLQDPQSGRIEAVSKDEYEDQQQAAGNAPLDAMTTNKMRDEYGMNAEANELEAQGIYVIPDGKMVVRRHGALWIVDAYSYDKEGNKIQRSSFPDSEIVVYGGESKPLDDKSVLGGWDDLKSVPGGIGRGTMDILGVLDKPRQWSNEQTGNVLYERASGNDVDLPGWDPLTGFIFGAPRNDLKPGQTKLTSDIGPIGEWADENPEKVIDLYENGYDSDGDGIVDYTGGEAVWEYWVGQQNKPTRIAVDVAGDPLNAATLGGGMLVRGGARVAGPTAARTLASRGLTTTGKLLRLPDTVMDTLISRGASGLYNTLTTEGMRATASKNLADDIAAVTGSAPVRGLAKLFQNTDETQISKQIADVDRPMASLVDQQAIDRGEIPPTSPATGTTPPTAPGSPGAPTAPSAPVDPTAPTAPTSAAPTPDVPTAPVETVSSVDTPPISRADVDRVGDDGKPLLPRSTRALYDNWEQQPVEGVADSPFSYREDGTPDAPDWDFAAPRTDEEGRAVAGLLEEDDYARRIVDESYVSIAARLPDRWRYFVENHNPKVKRFVQKERQLQAASQANKKSRGGKWDSHHSQLSAVNEARYIVDDLIPDFRAAFADEPIPPYRFKNETKSALPSAADNDQTLIDAAIFGDSQQAREARRVLGNRAFDKDDAHLQMLMPVIDEYRVKYLARLNGEMPAPRTPTRPGGTRSSVDIDSFLRTVGYDRIEDVPEDIKFAWGVDDSPRVSAEPNPPQMPGAPGTLGPAPEPTGTGIAPDPAAEMSVDIPGRLSPAPEATGTGISTEPEWIADAPDPIEPEPSPRRGVGRNAKPGQEGLGLADDAAAKAHRQRWDRANGFFRKQARAAGITSEEISAYARRRGYASSAELPIEDMARLERQIKQDPAGMKASFEDALAAQGPKGVAGIEQANPNDLISTYGMKKRDLQKALGISQPLQPRAKPFDEGHVRGIVDNYNGERMDPIIVKRGRDGKTYIVAGHNRHEAARRLGVDVPIRYTDAEGEELIRLSRETNMQNLGMSHVEIAASVRQLADEGRSFQQIGDALKLAPDGRNQTSATMAERYYNYSFLSERSNIKRLADQGIIDIRIASNAGRAIRLGHLTPAEVDEIALQVSKNIINEGYFSRLIRKAIRRAEEGRSTQMGGLFEGMGVSDNLRGAKDELDKDLRQWASDHDEWVALNEKKTTIGLEPQERVRMAQIDAEKARLGVELEIPEDKWYTRDPMSDGYMSRGYQADGTTAPAAQAESATTVDLSDARQAFDEADAAMRSEEPWQGSPAEDRDYGFSDEKLERGIQTVIDDIGKGVDLNKAADRVKRLQQNATRRFESMGQEGPYQDYVRDVGERAYSIIRQRANDADAARRAAQPQPAPPPRQPAPEFGSGPIVDEQLDEAGNPIQSAADTMRNSGAQPLFSQRQLPPTRFTSQASTSPSGVTAAVAVYDSPFGRLELPNLNLNSLRDRGRKIWGEAYGDRGDASFLPDRATPERPPRRSADAEYWGDPSRVTEPEVRYVRGRVITDWDQHILGQKFDDGEEILSRWERLAGDYERRGLTPEQADARAADQVMADWGEQVLKNYDARKGTDFHAKYLKEYERLTTKGKKADRLSGTHAQVVATQRAIGGTNTVTTFYDDYLGIMREMTLYNALSGPRYIMTQLIGNTITAMLTGNFGIIPEAMRGYKASYQQMSGRTDDWVMRMLGGVDDAELTPETMRKAIRELEGQPRMILHDSTDRMMVELNIAGMRDDITNVVRDEITEVGRPTKFSRLRLGTFEIGKRTDGVFANRAVRDMANAWDLSYRKAMYGHQLKLNNAGARIAFRQRMMDTMPSTMPTSEFNALWDELPEVFGADRIRNVFGEVDAKWADRMARDWQHAIRAMDADARDKTYKIFFSGHERNADKLLRRVFFFHYWMSRATPLYTESLIRNPGVLNAYVNMLEEIKEQEESGRFGPAVNGFLKFMSTPFGFNIFIRPDAFLQTVFALDDGSDFTPDGETFIGALMRKSPLMINPLIDSAANLLGLQGDTFAPDPLMLGQWTNLATNGTNYIKALVPGGGNEPTRNVVTDFWGLVRSHTSGIIPGTQQIDQTDSTLYARRDINYFIMEIAEEQGLDPLGPETMAAMDDPDSPLYQAGFKRYSEMKMTEHVLRFFPLTAPLYPKVRQENADETRYIISTAEPGSDEREQAFNERTIAQTGDPRARQLAIQQREYTSLGTDEERAAYSTYNAILYGGLDEPVVIDGVAVNDWMLFGMTQEEREVAADAWAEQTGNADKVATVKELRKEYRESHPEYAAYVEWRGDVSDFEGGAIEYWVDLAEGNDNAERYLSSVENASPDEVDMRLTSVEAYMHYMGIRPTIYDPNPLSVNNGRRDPYTPAASSGDGYGSGSGSGSGSSGGGSIQDDIDEYEAEMAEFTAKYGDLSRMTPPMREATIQQARDNGDSVPYLSGRAQDYYRWRDAQEPGTDTSIPAYEKWKEQNDPKKDDKKQSSVAPTQPQYTGSINELLSILQF